LNLQLIFFSNTDSGNKEIVDGLAALKQKVTAAEGAEGRAL